MRSYAPLENLWKRYNKALLDKVAVEKERSIVGSQNQQLRALLKQYLDSISVSDDVLTQANSLLIVNSRSNVPYVALVFNIRVFIHLLNLSPSTI